MFRSLGFAEGPRRGEDESEAGERGRGEDRVIVPLRRRGKSVEMAPDSTE